MVPLMYTLLANLVYLLAIFTLDLENGRPFFALEDEGLMLRCRAYELLLSYL